MKHLLRTNCLALAATLVVAISFYEVPQLHARGFGGFHGAGGFSGGGFRGGSFGQGFGGGNFDFGGGTRSGGFRSGGFDSGAFQGRTDAGGFSNPGRIDAGGFSNPGRIDAGGFSNAGHIDAGGISNVGRYDAGGYRAGGFDGSYHAGNLNGFATSHAALATDGGFGRAWTGAAASNYFVGNRTAPISDSVAAARGAEVRNSFNNWGSFRPSWYADHPGAWAATGWAAGRAWNAATWGGIYSWCGLTNDVQPIYYDYGNNITYQGDQVYYGTQPVATADEYYQQATAIAAMAPPPPAKDADWMPLGVFSLVQGNQSDANAVFQLALSKSGALAGNYSDMLAGTTLQVHGSLDKKNQRVCWTVGDNKTTVYESGIENLTKEQAPVLIHFGKDNTQQWMLVRLQDKQAAADK